MYMYKYMYMYRSKYMYMYMYMYKSNAFKCIMELRRPEARIWADDMKRSAVKPTFGTFAFDLNRK